MLLNVFRDIAIKETLEMNIDSEDVNEAMLVRERDSETISI